MADKKPCPDCARPLDPRGLTNHLRQAHANGTGAAYAEPRGAPAGFVAPLTDDADVRASEKELKLAKLRREINELEAPLAVEEALAEVHARLDAIEDRIGRLSDSEAVFLASFDRLSLRIVALEGRSAAWNAWR